MSEGYIPFVCHIERNRWAAKKDIPIIEIICKHLKIVSTIKKVVRMMVVIFTVIFILHYFLTIFSRHILCRMIINRILLKNILNKKIKDYIRKNYLFVISLKSR